MVLMITYTLNHFILIVIKTVYLETSVSTINGLK